MEKEDSSTLQQCRPIVKMTVDLLNTYKKINEHHFQLKAKLEKEKSLMSSKGGPLNRGNDDINNDYIIRIGECWADRFEILSNLGKGSFGQVVKAYDRINKQHYAIKIIKNKPPFYNQSLIEIELLEKMNKFDPHDQYKIVRFLGTFKHENHLCLIFEYLSYNLYELLKATHFYGLSLRLVRKFAIQILTALFFMSTSEVNVIHCDLKPENILLCNPKRSAIKVIDFGSACFSNEKMYKYIQSRYYRSPETILELEYSFSIDMWSLGCILFELHTGEPLFSGDDEIEQLVKIIEVLGIPPDHMIQNSIKARKIFARIPTESSEPPKPAFQLRNLPAVLRGKTPGSRKLYTLLGIGENRQKPSSSAEQPKTESLSDSLLFKDLLEKMLDFDPKTRITPLQALHHKFFNEFRDEASSTEAPHISNFVKLSTQPSLNRSKSMQNMTVAGPDQQQPMAIDITNTHDSFSKLSLK